MRPRLYTDLDGWTLSAGERDLRVYIDTTPYSLESSDHHYLRSIVISPELGDLPAILWVQISLVGAALVTNRKYQARNIISKYLLRETFNPFDFLKLGAGHLNTAVYIANLPNLGLR